MKKENPDHLGSSTVITDGSGYAYQLFLNLPFGETMAEQRRSGTFNNVYKFNDYGVRNLEKVLNEHSARSAELDTETGLYYYGARYYNPRISNWLSVDPIALWQPVQEVEHYIEGQHNGGYFNPKNMSVYGYTYQNPIVYIDPNGKQTLFQKFNHSSNFKYWIHKISTNIGHLNRKVSFTSIENESSFIEMITGNVSLTFTKNISHQRLKYFDQNGKETSRKNARSFSLHITTTLIKLTIGEDPSNRIDLTNTNYTEIGKSYIENFNKLNEYMDLEITRETLDYGLKGFIDENGVITTQNMGTIISDNKSESINSNLVKKYLDNSDYEKIGETVINYSISELIKNVAENNPNQ